MASRPVVMVCAQSQLPSLLEQSSTHTVCCSKTKKRSHQLCSISCQRQHACSGTRAASLVNVTCVTLLSLAYDLSFCFQSSHVDRGIMECRPMRVALARGRCEDEGNTANHSSSKASELCVSKKTYAVRTESWLVNALARMYHAKWLLR